MNHGGHNAAGRCIHEEVLGLTAWQPVCREHRDDAFWKGGQ